MSAARRVLFCHTEKQLPPLRRLPADAAPRARRLCLADATNSSEGAVAGAAAGAQCCAELSLTPCFVCSNGASSVPSSTGGSVEKRPQSPSSADPSSSSKRLRASVSTPSGVMGAIGDSAKRNSARAHAKNMLDTMVTTTSHPSNPRAVFDKLTGAELCNRSVFERVCIRVCVRSMSVRSAVVRCCADVARCCAPALVSQMLSNHAEGPKKFQLGKSASRFSFITTNTNLSRSCGLNCAFTTDSLYLPTVSISILLSFVTLHYSILTTGPTNQESTRAEWRSLKSISITSSRPASYGHTW